MADLYASHFDQIFRFCLRRVPNYQTAEDLTSETFLRAVRSIESFTWRGVEFGAWLTAIAKNVIIDHHRQAGRKNVWLIPEYFEDVLIRELRIDPMEDVQLAIDMRAAFSELTKAQQVCLELRFLRGMSCAETAHHTGSTSGAVRTLQFRALAALQRNRSLEDWVNA